MQKINIAYFGTPSFSTFVLDELEQRGMAPALVVTQPDKPAGRGMELQESPVKKWAAIRGITVTQPDDLKKNLTAFNGFDVFIVAAYGKLLPEELLALPRLGVFNVHPSLLPKYRGPSPIESQILAGETKVGVSIILLDAEMDHGPLLAQRTFSLQKPESRKTLEHLLWSAGGALLAETIPQVAAKTITPQEQDHTAATFTQKISKEDGLIDLAGDARENYLTYLAYEGWPGTYFFAEKNEKPLRVKIVSAAYENGVFTPQRVIPEGKKEMDYTDFSSSL